MHTELTTSQSGCISPSTQLGCDGHKRESLCTIFHGNFAYFCLNQDPNYSLVCFLEIHWIKMVVTWREREHEEEDMVALHDPGTITAL